MFHGISKVLWDFFEKHGVSPWYLIILVYLFAGYFQIKVFKNWKNSSTYERYSATIYLLALFIIIMVIVFSLIEGQSLRLS